MPPEQCCLPLRTAVNKERIPQKQIDLAFPSRGPCGELYTRGLKGAQHKCNNHIREHLKFGGLVQMLTAGLNVLNYTLFYDEDLI